MEELPTTEYIDVKEDLFIANYEVTREIPKMKVLPPKQEYKRLEYKKLDTPKIIEWKYPTPKPPSEMFLDSYAGYLGYCIAYYKNLDENKINNIQNKRVKYTI